jgi:hypothetical protein
MIFFVGIKAFFPAPGISFSSVGVLHRTKSAGVLIVTAEQFRRLGEVPGRIFNPSVLIIC